MLSLYRTLSTRYLRQRWTRALLIVASIALGVATLVATFSLNETMNKAIRVTANPLAGGADLTVSKGGETLIDCSLADLLYRVPGVDTVGWVNLTVINAKHLGQPGVFLVGKQSAAVIPWLRPPTTDLNLTLAMALISVIVTQIFGFIILGPKQHLSRFFNFSSPLLFYVGILELVSEIARIISLSFRLFGNIFAGGIVLALIGHRRYAAELNSLFSLLTFIAALKLAVQVIDRGSFVAVDELFFVDPFNVFLVALTALVSTPWHVTHE